MSTSLVDTNAFADNRYFDVEVEYAKASPQDILIEVVVKNRAKEDASLAVLPTLWSRNTLDDKGRGEAKDHKATANNSALLADHPLLESYTLSCEGSPEFLFTANETNEQYYSDPSWTGFPKGCLPPLSHPRGSLGGKPAASGTKAAVLYKINVPAEDEVRVRVRLAEGCGGFAQRLPRFRAIFEAP